MQFKVTGTTKVEFLTYTLLLLKRHVINVTFLQDLFGDGFAFWYARDRMVEGPVFGSKDFFSGKSNMRKTS